MRHLKEDPADLALATELSQKLLLLAPEAELPRLPGEERRPRPRPAGGAGGTRMRVPARWRRTGPARARPTAVRRPRRVRRPALQAPDPAGGGAGERGRPAGGDRAVAAGAFSGDGGTDTAPASNTTAAGAGARGFPLSNIKLDKSGDFQNAFAIQQGLQPLLPQTQAIYVTLARKDVVLKAIKTAVGSRKPILPVEGKTIFNGVVNSANASKGVIPIPLEAAPGVKGTGVAALGVSTSKQAFFELRLTGIEQPPEGSAYILWFVVS